MIRRPTIETKINHERWLVSYADFITLLFAFFVVMYSVSQVNESKYKLLSASLESTFSSQASASQVEETQIETLATMSDMKQQMGQALSGLIEHGVLNLSGNEEWLELELNTNVLFSSASAEPTKEAQRVFSKLADVLSPYDNAIEVSGHTDDIPIRNSRYENNWALSSSRAVSVVSLLAYGGIHPTRLSAVGYGEYRPVADNETEEGQSKNRRVVLRVERYSVKSEIVDSASLDQAGLGVTVLGNTELDNAGAGTNPDASDSRSQQALEAQALNSSGPETYIGPNVVEPVKLQSGGLLFSSNPELPRTNAPQDE
ncbi:MAG: chemotaxis protein MotB [Lentisphaeria bacterium]|jgi:chemotaxis protein MotB